MKLDRREVARYLGCGDRSPGENVEKMVDACERELEKTAIPRKAARRMERVQMPFHSADLDHHLKSCREVFLIALTLGAETDRLLRRWSAEHMGKAAVGQACTAAWMDQCCDEYLIGLEEELKTGEYLLPPYSPGYGDFSLSGQQDLLNLLNAGRRLGVSLTEGGMLVPEKTVTAVVGISDKKEERCLQKCMRCSKSDCPFRKGSGQ